MFFFFQGFHNLNIMNKMNINPKIKKWSSHSLVVVYTVFINILNELLFKFTGFIFIHFSLSLSFYYVLFVISVSLLYFFS